MKGGIEMETQMETHLISFSSEQANALAKDGWTTEQIANFSGLSKYRIKKLCTLRMQTLAICNPKTNGATEGRRKVMAHSTLVFVRVRSHRAADKLKRLLGCELAWYYSMHENNNFVEISADMLDAERQIKGITLARPKSELMRCWNL